MTRPARRFIGISMRAAVRGGGGGRSASPSRRRRDGVTARRTCGATEAPLDRPRLRDALPKTVAHRHSLAVSIVALALATGCAPRPLLERAIRARGGPLRNLTREGEARVRTGFPGVWRWRSVYLLPDRYALTVETATEPYHYLFDGGTVRAFLGTRAVATDPRREAPLRSHARFTAVAHLDALGLPRYRVAPLAPGELPDRAREGLLVIETDGGARYRLGFDEHGLVGWVVGPLDLDPLGRGEVTARFSDFRRVGGLLLPFRTAYGFGDTLLLEETATAVCPNQPDVTADSFLAPAQLPACGERGF